MGGCVDVRLLKDSTPRDLLHLFRYYWGRGFVTPKDTVLDIGFGSGYGTGLLSKVAKKVTGIEILAENRECAKEKYGQKNNEFVTGNVEKMKLPSCDVACAFEVIEHLYQPKAFVEKLKKATKKYIVMSVPIGESLINVGGDIQVDGDPTHHSVFADGSEVEHLFLDNNWATFYRFQDGVTFFGSFYNVNNI
jgi:SAM-dependent methyltransferase